MSSVFLVVYTSAHLIGAVSYPLGDQLCANALGRWTWTGALDWDGGRHDKKDKDVDGNEKVDGVATLACEKHDTRPKVQTQIDQELRERFESDCENLYQSYFEYKECRQLPNGDVEMTQHDDDGNNRHSWVVKLDQRWKTVRLKEKKARQDECDQIEGMFDACSVSVQRPDFCYMVHRAGAGESRGVSQFFARHPSVSFGKKMDKLCLKVCYGKTTVIGATRKFCPHQRPHSMDDMRVDPDIPGSTARSSYRAKKVATTDSEPYTPRDCQTIEMLVEACRVSGERIPAELTKEEQLTLSRAYIWLGARHESWSGASGFAPTCTQLFESKITGGEVLHRYCPNYRPSK
ncbi:hypothetical protein [Bradyrhizobium vignae]|uniref:Uncharacterized protein n=1 Tax=Bradyrhizobium vignae TaxID=1549949 RepID=A0A2U3PS96_9BRAD|nr:hypothetical protein [Bradyrhizobium vignae]SPP91994.1 protein of unknown function [Bradyrhizobium vignae]